MIRWSILLSTLLAGLIVTSLALGDIALSWQDLWQILVGAQDANTQNVMILYDLRLPRVLLAALVGAALAVSGTITLAIMRNPLAEPGVLGINSGAAAAVMAVIVLLRDPPVVLLPAAGFLGAVAMAAAVYFLSWRGGTSSSRIILIGIGLGSLASAATTFLSAFGEIGDVQRAMIWLAGSVYNADLAKVHFLLLWLIVPLALVWMAARQLDLIRFGDDTAKSFGQSVDRVRGLLIVLCTLISGAAIAAAGLIGFVGLVAPHVAIRLVGPSHARILPVAGLCGAILVVAADLVGRLIIAPIQVPAGIVTGLIGAPFFASLFWKRRHARG